MKKFLDTAGLTTYDSKIKEYIDDIIENDIGPAINAKANDTVFGASGSNHSKGLVPDPGLTQGSTKFLREDSSWAVPALDPSSMPTVTGTVSLSGAAQANWTQTDNSADDYIKNKPSLATVATSGSYNDLSNKPSIPAAQVQSDWNVTNSSSKAYIKNKPTIPSVSTATSIADGVTGYTTGDQVYDYAENKANKSTTISSSSTDTQYPSALAVKTYVDAHGFDPSSMSTASGTVTITGASSVQSDWSQSDNTAADYIKNKPSLATVATSGSYNDLSNKPSIPAAQIQSDWSVTNTSSKAYIKNKPTIPSAASSIADNVTGYATGDQVYDYAEAKSNKTTAISSSSTDTQYPSALAVKTYVDNHGFDPSSMPEVTTPITLNQTQVDWNQTDNTAVDYIKNKPTLATVATSGSYNDLSNKPTIPTVAQAITSGDNGYVTGDMVYDVLGDLETFLSNY